MTDWNGLTPFTQGYVEALFTGLPGWTLAGGRSVGFIDLAPKTLAQIIADCDEMCGGDESLSSNKKLGHTCWKTRQNPHLESRHGFKPLTIQLGDDGKVRFAA